MAQKVQMMLLCDLEDGTAEAQETVQFAVGSSSYELDVCATHAQQIRSGLEPYVTHARKAGSTGGAARRRRERSAVSRAQSANIRAWAKERGLQVNERGRIPESVVAEYEQAH